jgi:hypothetical protein
MQGAAPLVTEPGTVDVIYRQEPVEDLRRSTQVHYTKEALAANPSLYNGFLAQELNDRYDVFNHNRTQFVMFGQKVNPVPEVLSRSLEDLTGLAVLPAAVDACQLGVDGGPEKGVNALQAKGTALGASLAPRALTDQPFIHGVFAAYNWAEPVVAFPEGPADRIRVEGYFRHPHTSVKQVGEGLVAQEGTVYFYYTLQFRDMTQDRDLWFCVRLYQDKFARPSDPWPGLKDEDGVGVDGTDPATSIGFIDTIMRPASTRITPLPRSAHFSLVPFEGERYFAFDLSAAQFRQGLKDLNAAKVAHVVYSEDPKDYRLKHYNINVESWAPSMECDPRIALSWRDIQISLSSK